MHNNTPAAFDVQTTYVGVPPEFKHEIRVHRSTPLNGAANSPVVLYLPGYRDDMNNRKRDAAEKAALGSGAAFVTLDYRGHGESRGPINNESLTTYKEDARMALLSSFSDAPCVIIAGHSIGGINALYLAHELETESPGRIASVIGIAPVVAFMDEGHLGHRIYMGRGQQELKETGNMTNPYAKTLVYSPEFIADYQNQSLLRDDKRELLHNIPFPVHLLVSSKDAFSPVEDANHLTAQLRSAQIETCQGARHTMDDDNSLEKIGEVIRRASSAARARRPQELVA